MSCSIVATPAPSSRGGRSAVLSHHLAQMEALSEIMDALKKHLD